MKKIYAIAALALFTLNATAQKKAAPKKQQPKKEAAQPKKEAQPDVIFNVEYKAATTYVQTMDMDMDLGIIMAEEAEPIVQEMDMSIIYTINTGAAKSGDVPFSAEMGIDSPLVPGAGDQLADTKFYGRFVKGQPTIDSVTVAGKNNTVAAEELKSAFSKALNQFPTTPVNLKIGESFKTANLPVDLPGLSMGGGVDTSITYTLTKVEGNNAYFNLLLDTPLELETNGIAMKGTMKMKGTMIYDTKVRYVSSQDIDMDAAFNMSQEGRDMKMTIIGKNKANTKVTPN